MRIISKYKICCGHMLSLVKRTDTELFVTVLQDTIIMTEFFK